MTADAIDHVAREQAQRAENAARSSWEAFGQVLRELSALNGKVDSGFRRIDQALGLDQLVKQPEGNGEGAEHDDDGEAHSWGRRAYDPEEEITQNGTRVRVELAGFRRMQADIAAMKKSARDATLRQKGADDLVRLWKRRAKLAIAVGGPALGAIGWALHWLLYSGGLAAIAGAHGGH